MTGTILLGIDVETSDGGGKTYAECGPKFYEQLEIPVTWYVCGKTLAASPDQFVAADHHPLIDIQSHTHEHIRLKTVLTEVFHEHVVCGEKDWSLIEGASINEIEADLALCQETFEKILGRRAIGLTAPYGHYRGLGDRPDILRIIDRFGFQFIRSDARNEKDGLPHSFDTQPYFYNVQGFPFMLELCIHDYMDDFIYAEYTGKTDIEDFVRHLKKVADKVAEEDIVWSLCSHDHKCHTKEGFIHKTYWISQLVPYAKSLGIKFTSATEYFLSRLQKQNMD